MIALTSQDEPLRPAVSFQLRDHQPDRPAEARAGRRRRAIAHAVRLQHAHLGRSRPACRFRHDAGRHRQCAQAPEHPGRHRPRRRAACAARPAVPAYDPDQGPAELQPRSSATSLCAPTRTEPSCGCATWRASSLPRGFPSRSAGWTAAPAAIIGIYQAPGGNAISSAGGSARDPRRRQGIVSRRRSTTRSPTTPRSSSTRASTRCIKTLLEAFVLVVIVVFLFLGSVRATLIPLIAVPVSLIGTFAVMLALGYSANTVSLLALVLAIGIVVDDAIVVVEAVEAKMEADPHHRACRGGPRSAMKRDHRADHRHHAGAAVGVRAGRLHPRHFGRTVPPVRGRRHRLDGDLGDQRADAVARRCARVLLQAQPRAQAWRRCAISWRGIDLARDGYARHRASGWCAWPSSASWRWR